jgi:hypothetical protein
VRNEVRSSKETSLSGNDTPSTHLPKVYELPACQYTRFPAYASEQALPRRRAGRLSKQISANT